MILEQEIEVMVSSKTIKHWEGLGYTITTYVDSKNRVKKLEESCVSLVIQPSDY